VDNKFGFFDAPTSKVIIPPTYDWCSNFNNGYALVRNISNKMHDDSYKKIRNGEITMLGNVESNDWDWATDSRCGYIDQTGKVVIPLNYIDGDPIPLNGRFIVRKPGSLVGLIDLNDKKIIDFDRHGIKELPHPHYNNYVAYTERDSIREYSLFNKQGELILDNLDKDPTDEDCKQLVKFRKKLKKLKFGGWYADEIYLIIQYNKKYGAVAFGRLICRPYMSLSELWSIIKDDWKLHVHKKNKDVALNLDEIRSVFGENPG